MDLPLDRLSYVLPSPPAAGAKFEGRTAFAVPMCLEELLQFKRAFESSVTAQSGMQQFGQEAGQAARLLEEAHMWAAAETQEPRAYKAAFKRHAAWIQVPADVVDMLVGQLHGLLHESLTTAQQHLARRRLPCMDTC